MSYESLGNITGVGVVASLLGFDRLVGVPIYPLWHLF